LPSRHACTAQSLRPTGTAPGARTSLSLLSRFPSIDPVEQLVDVAAVEVVGKFRLRLTFEDGTVGDVDFSAREWRGVLEPLSDPAYFARVYVDPEAGTIAWPNGVDLAPEPLYEEARRNLVQSASSAR
jgi:hypothetical protein